ncbi:hypothetical protein EDF63_2801 [Curtobacterium sp. JUb34]|nr:hypothetical protein EDF63_2801 [Curtobacterium sp. JUb34]
MSALLRARTGSGTRPPGGREAGCRLAPRLPSLVAPTVDTEDVNARIPGRVDVGAAVILTAALSAAGCSNAPGSKAADPSEAKQSIVSIVEESADAVGGDWTVYRGPAAEVCTQSGGGDGARFVYILERSDTDGTDPAADIRTVEELWQAKGITTERFESGGSDPLTGIRGADGPVTSIGFNAYPQRYSITGVSKCSDGDVKDLRSPE